MIDPLPDPRPLVYVREARILARTAARAKPTWVLRLFCGHTVERKAETEPRRVRCGVCGEQP
jgi:hypothetical protein